MAHSSNRTNETDTLWPSLHEPDERIEQSAEAWAHAPSREVTGDVPESVNASIERTRRVDENAPGVDDAPDALVARERDDERDHLEGRDDEPTLIAKDDPATAEARRRGDH